MFSRSIFQFILNYNLSSNPIRESFISSILLIVNSLQIWTLNGFIRPGTTKIVLRSWLEVLRLPRLSTWTVLTTQPMFSIFTIIVYGIAVLLALYILIFSQRSDSLQKFIVSTFKALVTVCDLILFIPAMDFLMRAYVPQTVFIPGQLGFMFWLIPNSSASPAWWSYIFLASFTSLIVIPVFTLIEYSFRTIFQDKLVTGNIYINRLQMILVFTVCLLAWRTEENELPAIFVDVFACILAVTQVVMSLTWTSFQNPETHLLHGCLSAFYLSHSICMIVIHQLPDDASFTGAMDVAYFFIGTLFVKLYHNFHKRIFYTSSQSFSIFWRSKKFTQISEKHTIFRLIHSKKDDDDFKTEAAFYLQNHFAACQDPAGCFCIHLKKLQALDSDMFQSLNRRSFEEFLTHRLIAILTTPGSRDYGSLSLLVKIINYVGYQCENPVRACLTLAQISSCVKLDKLTSSFYHILIIELKKMIEGNLSEAEQSRYHENFHEGVAFHEELQSLRTRELEIKTKYSEFFTYLDENGLVQLELLQQKGLALIKSIQDFEQKLEKLSDLNHDSAEVIELIIRFKTDFFTSTKHTINALYLKLGIILQKRSLRALAYKQKDMLNKREIIDYDKENIFLLIDLVHNPGDITQTSGNFCDVFGYSKEHIKRKNSLHISELIPSKASEAHRNILNKFRESASSMFGTHDFGKVQYCLTSKRMLVPAQISVKIEIHDSQIYCAAAIRPEKISKDIILTDEKGYIVSYTEGLSKMMEGIHEFSKTERLNICMLMPAMSPIVFSEDTEVKETKTMIHTHLFLCHKQQRMLMNDTRAWKSFTKLSGGFRDVKDGRKSSHDILDLLSIMPMNENQILNVDAAVRYQNHASIEVGYWEIEFLKIDSQNGLTVSNLIPSLLANVATKIPGDPTNDSEKKKSKFAEVQDTESDVSYSRNDMSMAPDEQAEVQLSVSRQMRATVKNNCLNLPAIEPNQKAQAQLKLEINAEEKRSQNHRRTRVLIDNRTRVKELSVKEGSVSIQSSEGIFKKLKGRAHLKSGDPSEKVGVKASESASRASKSSYFALQKTLRTKNSFGMLKSYFLLGIFATIIIVIVSVLNFVITNSALSVLAQLTNINLHPSQVATYIQYSRKEVMKLAAISKGLIPASMGLSSALLINYYLPLYEGEFASILNNTIPLNILADHLNNHLIEIYIPTSQQNQTCTLIDAVGMLEVWQLLEYKAVTNNANSSSVNFTPRIFFEVNGDKIQDNLMTLFLSMQAGITQKNNLMMTLNLTCLLIGCGIIFAVLVFLIILYSRITKKKYQFLVVFCKISKKDLQYEATRLFEKPKSAPKKAIVTDKTGKKSEISSERMFTNYVTPQIPFPFLGVFFVFAFGILILPLLVCYLKLSIYSKHWGEGISQYNTWEALRTTLVGSFSDAMAVYSNSDTNDQDFYMSLEAFQMKTEILQNLVSQLNELMSQFGVLDNQDLYQGDIGDQLGDSTKGSWCTYLQTTQPSINSCNSYLGGIANQGLASTVNLLTSLQADYISRLTNSTNPASTMKGITSEQAFSDSDNLLLWLNRGMRIFAVEFHDNLLNYLDTIRKFLNIILSISIAAYLLIMLTGWTILVRKFSYQLNDTKNILSIVPQRVLRGNSFIKNFLLKEIRVSY